MTSDSSKLPQVPITQLNYQVFSQVPFTNNDHKLGIENYQVPMTSDSSKLSQVPITQLNYNKNFQVTFTTNYHKLGIENYHKYL